MVMFSVIHLIVVSTIFKLYDFNESPIVSYGIQYVPTILVRVLEKVGGGGGSIWYLPLLLFQNCGETCPPSCFIMISETTVKLIYHSRKSVITHYSLQVKNVWPLTQMGYLLLELVYFSQNKYSLIDNDIHLLVKVWASRWAEDHLQYFLGLCFHDLKDCGTDERNW